MIERERSIAVETHEQLAAHMVAMDFALSERGVDYQSLVGLSATLESFRVELGDQLGVQRIAAHIDLPDRMLRVVTHVDGFRSDADEVVGYVARIVEDCGVEIPLGLPDYTVQTTALLEAS